MVFLTGFLMAIADSVPGVSGGTIAYIMKQYELLFKHINNILSLNFKKESLQYVLKLGIGWIIGFVLAILAISQFFESHIYQVSSLFLGFIIVSLAIIIKEEKTHLNGKDLIYTFLGFAFVLVLVFFQNSNVIALDANNLNIVSYIYIFLVGFFAIGAMLLPGISGSAVLMIFGIYFITIESIHNFLLFNFESILILIALGMGILIGAISSIKAISYLLEAKYSMMIHLIIGLLIGSIISIIMGPTTIAEIGLKPLSLETFSLFSFTVGIAIIVCLKLFVKMKRSA